MSTATDPRVRDNDRDEITVTLEGKEIRGWSYENEAERRMKMLAAREFCEGWFQAYSAGRTAKAEAFFNHIEKARAAGKDWWADALEKMLTEQVTLTSALDRLVNPAPGVSDKLPAWAYGIAKATLDSVTGKEAA